MPGTSCGQWSGLSGTWAAARMYYVCLHVTGPGSAGFGPQKLATLAAYALRRNLLDWLETFKVEKVCAARLAKQREAASLQVCNGLVFLGNLLASALRIASLCCQDALCPAYEL